MSPVSVKIDKGCKGSRSEGEGCSGADPELLLGGGANPWGGGAYPIF